MSKGLQDDYDSMLKSVALFQALLSEWSESVMSGFHNRLVVNIRGYMDIDRYQNPELIDHRFSRNEIEMIILRNPQNAFGIRVREFSE